MITNREQAIEAITRIGLPAIFHDIYSGSTTGSMAGGFRHPSAYFAYVALYPGEISDSWVPLWDSYGSPVYIFDSDERQYLSWWFEEDPYPEVVATNYQQFVTVTLFKLLDGGMSTDELEDLASRFQYEHLSRLKDFRRTITRAGAVEMIKGFIASIE